MLVIQDLKQDLQRRDLTINAIAKDTETGELIDPFGGMIDLVDKLLRPVSDAFCEDPIRVLRVGRFLARFPDFKETNTLYHLSLKVVKEIGNCSPERVWKEIEKVLSEKVPSKFFKWMANFNTFPILDEMSRTPQKPEHHPEIWVDVHTYMTMDYAAKIFNKSEVTFACFCHDFGKPETYTTHGNAFGHEDAGVPFIEDFCNKWKVPNSYKDLAIMTAKHHTKIHGCLGRGSNQGMKAKTIMKLFEETNALKKHDRFMDMLLACVADSRGRGADKEDQQRYEDKPYPQADYLLECLCAASLLDTKTISIPAIEAGLTGTKIGDKIRAARINEIRKVQQKWGNK